jgi:hypothetical protein
MIKYAEIEGYINLGEVKIFSHVYQLIEKDKDTPMVILIHAYECSTKIFKGFIFNKNQTYESIPLTDAELSEIEKLTGKAEQVDFKQFVIGTILEDVFKDYMCIE